MDLDNAFTSTLTTQQALYPPIPPSIDPPSLSNLGNSNFGPHSIDWNDRFIRVPQHVAISPMSSLSTSSGVSPSVPDNLACDVGRCGAQFIGDYRKGNLARHMRLKHGASERIYPCEAPNCRREFKRQDARVKHYRRHHIELSRGPANARKPHS